MSESTAPTGKHLIAGDWVAGEKTFTSTPVTGAGREFALGGEAEIDRAAKAAEEAFEAYAATSREERAKFLDTIAEEIDKRGEAITEHGTAETGLPAGRLQGERGRTTGQLRLFAEHIRKGEYLDRRHDAAQPDREPAPRPDLRMIERPIGPVGVFGASNFPLAFSTAGGDTASALAAGCPVVVKGHPGHPATAELVAQAIDAAIKSCGMPAGTFSLVQSNTNEAGEALVRHPLIKAVGFTGSQKGGRALFDIATSREEPIPLFAEMGSVNPVFVMPEALKARGAEIGKAWAGSLTMGVGQFCTNPGVVVLPEGAEGDAFLEAAQAALQEVDSQVMLTEGTAEAYRSGTDRFAGGGGVKELLRPGSEGREGAPALFSVSASDWEKSPELAGEVFGPAGIAVRVSDMEEAKRLAEGFEGQLTVTLQMDDGDTEAARSLMPVLERKAGRVLANGFPTGVEVADSMVHGGPYPASTNFGATSVGTLAIRRFLRPVCYQNIPEALLPADLRD